MKIQFTKIISINFLFLLVIHASVAQEIPLQWEAREDLNITLPTSVRVFEANGYLPDSARIRAYYAKIDLTDENLNIRALGSKEIRRTTEEAYYKNNGIFAINGGYFSSNASVSLLVSDGETIAPGPVGEGIKGAFGLKENTPEIVWSNAKTPNSPPLKYEQPDSTANSVVWNVDQAVGGGPVLVKNGQIKVTSIEEGFGGSHLIRHPRTAIGYSADRKHLIVMVVDGRQNTSGGVTLPELAQLMKQAGATEALNLDGGGSSAMVAADEVVNIPADIPGGDRNNLRNNASALIVSLAREEADPEIYYFDTKDKAYSEKGLWRSSKNVNYYAGSPSRIASAAHFYNKAFFRLDSIPRKEYQLAAWWTVNPEQNSEEVSFVIHQGKNIDRVTVDQTELSTSGKWNILGNFILGSGDYIEIKGTGKKGNLVTDAIRLISTTNSPEVPVRGKFRVAVLSDLNSGLGATDYEWQVDSIINRIPRIWQPDLVLIGGDMVAGMGISDSVQLQKMWEGFDKHIAAPLQKAGIPLAFTIGNHDGPRSYPKERAATVKYWQDSLNIPNLNFIDKSHFPHYYSFREGDVFFISWDASSPEITEENLEWMKQQLETPQAKNADYRFVIGHMPLYSVAQERDSKGNVLENPEKLQELLEKYNVHTYISGHQHAYYPGKHGNLQLLHAGAAGAGARRWLNQEMQPQNTMTLLDFFPEKDTIVYSTYKIKEQKAQNMEYFEVKELPSVIFGVNGYVLRRDIPITDEAQGSFSRFNSVSKSNETGKGSVTAEISGGNLLISGHYFSLKGELVEENPIKLFKGRNTEKGKLLTPLEVTSKNGGLGMFKGKIPATPEVRELLSVGALYVVINTDDGVLRTQLYPANNQVPPTPSIITHNGRNVYAVRDVEAMFEISWEEENDSNGDFISFIYQLSSDPHFNKILLQEKTGRTTSFQMTEKQWYDLLGNAGIGDQVTFYHRVIATDGKNISYSPTEALKLLKSNEPLYDLIEVAAPNYEFKGKIKDSGGGYGVVWDNEGKIWLATYRNGLTIKQKNGTDADFSPLTTVEINGVQHLLNPITGIGTDRDGNILLGNNTKLIKIDAETGAGLAVWKVPEGERAITSPRVNAKGEIYAMSLFADDPDYVLKESATNPTTFELVRTLDLKNRVLSRTFDMTDDGLVLYFPDPGSSVIQKYTSTDGINYTKEENITSTASGSSAIHITDDKQLFAAVRASGISPSTFHFRDEENKRMWTLELPEVNGAEPRGIGVSPDQKTLIFAAWDKGGGFYKYELEE